MKLATPPFSYPSPIASKPGEPVWEVARLYPAQGEWSEEAYLELDKAGNTLIEFTDGYVEMLPMPTVEHQRIVMCMVLALNEFSRPGKLGEVFTAPLPLKLRTRVYREPDIIFVLQQNRPKGNYPERADLVVEVVSAGKANRVRDVNTKRLEYAAAGIPEYWIVDPKDGQITVLKLDGKTYIEHGVFKKGATATSALLNGFSVDVTKALAAD